VREDAHLKDTGLPDTTAEASLDASDGSARDAGCEGGTFGCNGEQPEACLLSGTWVSVGAPCSGSTPVCRAGSCLPCAPGASRCSGAELDSGAGVETCNAGGQWGATVACAQSTPVCGEREGMAACCATVCSGACVDEETNDENCGGCGLACSTGCIAGRCVVTLASGQGAEYAPTAIVVDMTNVYWTDDVGAPGSGGGPPASMGAVSSMPINGGTRTTLAYQVTYPDAIAVDATSIYLGTAVGTVMKVPINGGAPTTLASGAYGVGGIAVDATNVYWTSPANCDHACSPSFLMSVPIGGGTPTTLASDPNGPACGVAVDATNAYWTANDVLKVPLGGGMATTLAAAQGAQALAVDSTNVYWTTYGSVMAMPLTGGAPTTLASGQNGVVAFAVDATNVYWTTETGPSLTKAPLGGGDPTTLVATVAVDQYPHYGLAVDATSVYWTDETDGAVLKLTPK
jgi:hypothetical protein